MISFLFALQTTPAVLADRLAFGVRYQRAEVAWTATQDKSRKLEATSKLSEAVISFFTNNFAKGCRSTDEAIAILEGRKWRPEDALEIRLTKRVTGKEENPEVEYGWTYPVADGAVVKFSIDTREFSLNSASKPTRVTMVSGNHAALNLFDLERRSMAFSVKSAYAGADFRLVHQPSANPLVTDLLTLLEEQEKKTEVQLPLKGFAEDLKLTSEKRFFELSQVRRASYQGTVLRSTVPQPGVKKVTVLVGLHGAGGSENFFFEAYGGGIGPKLATQRGWVFVAPRTSAKAVDASVAFVENTFGVKVKQLYVMGHSMGGGTAIGYNSTERTLSGVALFAPAGRKLSEKVATVPTYLAIGKQDLAMLGASAQALKPQVLATPGGVFKEFEPSEHTMIVPDAIREAFAFFDKLSK